MYHFTHDYKHRLHTRMQAIAQTYNIPTHTRMCIILSCIGRHMCYIIAHTPHSVHNTHLYASQTDCGITGMQNQYSKKAKTITMVNILLIVDTLIQYIELHTHTLTY